MYSDQKYPKLTYQIKSFTVKKIRRYLAGNVRQLFWSDVKNKSVEKIDAPLVHSLAITEKRFDAGISFAIQENPVNTAEKFGLKTEYLKYAGISPDPEITDV